MLEVSLIYVLAWHRYRKSYGVGTACEHGEVLCMHRALMRAQCWGVQPDALEQCTKQGLPEEGVFFVDQDR